MAKDKTQSLSAAASGSSVVTYRVFFGQVNRNCFEIRAKSPAAAIKKGRALWRRENADPDPMAIERQSNNAAAPQVAASNGLNSRT